MIFIYLQNIRLGARTKIPFRIVLYSDDFVQDYKVFPIRPELSIPNKIYKMNDLNRLEILASEPFCDSADELIDLLRERKLIFSEKIQFDLLKSQFKNIGYNFNLKPTILWPSGKIGNKNLEQITELISERLPTNSLKYAEVFLNEMHNFKNLRSEQLEEYKCANLKLRNHDLSKHKKTPGVYFFLNANDKVIYVGKAKNIRKRLQSHFSNTIKQSNIDYSQVEDIDVIYTGNDIIAQLVESSNIKSLKPSYNVQQILNPDPYIITLGYTSKGISKIKITRKEYEDSLPEKYFNRRSVVASLADFCQEYSLCRKHCGLEKVKGPCSNYTKNHKDCVCSGGESIEEYNKRFQLTFDQFRRKKTRKIYRLKGRNNSEDAFIYEFNGIYEGYGYIDRNVDISNYNDVLGHLIKQTNNYDTTRIISSLTKVLRKEDILFI
tara:strand:+ start:31332 stop:32639 length:1308 start_codon:yes stop_codon:yes gene_type:complete